MAQRPHYDLIIAWAEGKEIELFDEVMEGWVVIEFPSFNPKSKYRVKTAWYENIPQQGILCWVWDSDESLKYPTFVKGYEYACAFPFIGGVRWKNAIPLTLEEVGQFII
jgi:hypothetical protein